MKEINDIKQLFSEQKITRREFIARATALGVGATVLPGILSSPVKAATPKKGGRFRIGLTGGSISDILDPATSDSNFISFASYCIRQNLVEIDYQGNAVPELAESWEASADASTWMFKLRQGVEFHNGKTMTSEDVIYSLNHHRGEDSKSGAKGVMAQITDIKADGKYGVVFTLESGNAEFQYVLNDYHVLIAPAGTKGAQWDEGIGTGGYILQEWETGVRALFKRNPNYWKSGRAHFDEVEILGIDDNTARTSALKTGQIDYMDRAETKTVHLLKKMKGIQVIRVPSGFHYTMPMLTDVAPFDNNDVRLALKYAIDRKLIVDNVLQGYGTIGNDHPILTQPFYASELPQREYDPDKAKFHLKKAGLSGHTFDLYAMSLANFIDMCLIFKESASKAGVNINVIRKPEDGYWEDVWLKVPFCLSWWAARPTCDVQFSVAYSGNAPWNETRFKHKRFDGLVKAARGELDNKKRREMYVECQRILRDEGGAVIPCFKDYVEAASDKVRFENIASNFELDGLHASERWWFA